MDYRPTIGLEIHAELKTKTKLFCNSKNDPNEARPNVNICPVCMGYPGTLPAINTEAIRHMLRIGLAVGGALADVTYFDRKNYFYPDIPKGYQISQYKHPLVTGGTLAGVAITRVHLEEDTARSQHMKESSLIDFNRAGVPLMELVTEPVIESAEEAGRFARELQLLLRHLEAGEANMEKGEMRVEANVSVSPNGTDGPNRSNGAVGRTDLQNKSVLGTKVEVKNLNSFRSVERAILYEIKRQSAALESGERVSQETRGWDEGGQQTFPQRVKEGSADYRYFPEPDLTVFNIPECFDTKELAESLPELPAERRARYRGDFGLKKEDVEVYVQNKLLGSYIERVAKELQQDEKKIALASNYITSDLIGHYKESGLPERIPIDAKDFAALVHMAASGDVSSRGAKDILHIMLTEGGEPAVIATDKKLLQKSDENELLETVKQIVAEHTTVAEEYRNGKEAALQFLVGQGMKATKGAANPEVLKKLFVAQLQ